MSRWCPLSPRAEAEVLRLLTEAGPAGLIRAEIVDPTHDARYLSRVLYLMQRAGQVWSHTFGLSGVKRVRLSRYFVRQDWCEASHKAAKAARREAKREYMASVYKRLPKPPAPPKVKTAEPKRAKAEPNASQTRAKSAPKAMTVKRERLAASVAAAIPAKPESTFHKREAENLDTFEFEPAKPFVDTRFDIDPATVPSRINSSECRPWAAMLGRVA